MGVLFTKIGQDAINNKMPKNGNRIQSESVSILLKQIEKLDSKIKKATDSKDKNKLNNLQSLFSERKDLNFELSSILAEQGEYYPKVDNSMPSVQC